MVWGNSPLDLWTSNPKVTGSIPVGCGFGCIRRGNSSKSASFLTARVSWGRFETQNRLFNGDSQRGRGGDLLRFCQRVVPAAQTSAQKLGHRRVKDPLLFQTVAHMADDAAGHRTKTHRGIDRGIERGRSVTVNGAASVFSSARHLQRCSGAGTHQSKPVHFGRGAFTAKITTVTKKQGDCVDGLSNTVRIGAYVTGRNLCGAVFHRGKSRRGFGSSVVRLGPSTGALGLFAGRAAISHSAGTNRTRDKDRGDKISADSSGFSPNSCGLASSVVGGGRSPAKAGQPDLCYANQKTELAGRFAEKSLKGRSCPPRVRREAHNARPAPFIHHARARSGGRFTDLAQNHASITERYSRPVHAPKLGAALRGGEYDQNSRGQAGPLRGQH